jgi:hypothetical protein
MTSHFTIINLPTYKESRGDLTVLENKLPFAIMRTYWIYGADSQIRGGHRHTHTRQALVAIAGEVEIFMDDGIVSETIKLAKPSQCLLVEPKDWHTMKFGVGSVLLVMSSHAYDRSEYIDTPYSEQNNKS